jgi:hypothetical protein
VFLLMRAAASPPTSAGGAVPASAVAYRLAAVRANRTLDFVGSFSVDATQGNPSKCLD